MILQILTIILLVALSVFNHVYLYQAYLIQKNEISDNRLALRVMVGMIVFVVLVLIFVGAFGVLWLPFLMNGVGQNEFNKISHLVFYLLLLPLYQTTMKIKDYKWLFLYWLSNVAIFYLFLQFTT